MTLSDDTARAATEPRRPLKLLTSGDEGYEDARVVWNGMIDRKPNYIVLCRDVADVVAGVALAAEHSLPVSIRGGGHNVPAMRSATLA